MIKYIFNFIAFIVLLSSFIVYQIFNDTKQSIEKNSLNSNLTHIDNLTNNIAILIKQNLTKNDLHTMLKNNINIRHNLEESLRVLSTEKYRYIYVVDKQTPTSHQFRFLLDGSNNIDDKSEFDEWYTPIDPSKWNKVYKTKKSVYFNHNDIKSIWLTYLKPIIINNEVKAIIAIDFSLVAHENIINSLDQLDSIFKTAVIFSTFIFITIVIFAYIDNKRQKLLRENSKKIEEFNETLQRKITIEVNNNRKKDKQILEQSRLAQMGEMLSMIAHQWRQPLAAISSTSSAMILKTKLSKLDSKQTIEYSTKITDYAQHLSSTIDDFRDFFKSNKIQQQITYKELIDSVMNIIEVSLLNKHITLKENLKSEKILFTYPNELKQVILNIIKNAEDVLIEKKIQNPIITIETKDNFLIIKDNGQGVQEDIIDNIFDPYYSTKLKKDGTGLGLYMSKIIVEEHCGGKLSVKNDSHGAVFKIELPLS